MRENNVPTSSNFIKTLTDSAMADLIWLEYVDEAGYAETEEENVCNKYLNKVLAGLDVLDEEKNLLLHMLDDRDSSYIKFGIRQGVLRTLERLRKIDPTEGVIV